MVLRTAQNFDPNATPEENQQNQQITRATPSPLGGSGGIGGQIAKKPTGSGRFVNIQNYLKAGEGGAKRLGQATQEKLGEQQKQAKESQEQISSSFGEAVDRSKAGVNQEQASGLLQRLRQSPTGLSSEEQSQAQQLYNLQYGGPRQLTDLDQYGQAYQTSEKAKEAGQLAGTESGRYQLLRQQFGQPRYTTGQTALDVALLGSDLGTSRAVSQAGQAAQAQGKKFTEVEAEAARRAGVTEEEINQMRTQAQQEVGAETEETQGAIMSALERLRGERETSLPRLTEMLGRREISSDLLSRTNLGDLVGQELYGAQITPEYLQLPELTEETVASPEQAKAINILRQISGQPTAMREDLAGTASGETPFKFNVDELRRQIEERRGNYETGRNQAIVEAERIARERGQVGLTTDQYRQGREVESYTNKLLSGEQLNPQELASLTNLSKQTSPLGLRAARVLETVTSPGYNPNAVRQAALSDVRGMLTSWQPQADREEAALNALRQEGLNRIMQQFDIGKQLRLV